LALIVFEGVIVTNGAWDLDVFPDVLPCWVEIDMCLDLGRSNAALDFQAVCRSNNDLTNDTMFVYFGN
jgi:hypothetical protein